MTIAELEFLLRCYKATLKDTSAWFSFEFSALGSQSSDPTMATITISHTTSSGDREVVFSGKSVGEAAEWLRDQIKSRLFRIIVAGGREFADYDYLASTMGAVTANLDHFIVIHGDCRGADKLAGRWTTEHGHKCVPCPAEWDLFGKAAGPRRNELMAQNADALVAFWDGKSTGTSGMIKLAETYGLKVRVKRY